MKETIEKINNELREFWNKNQKKHPDICKYLELLGVVVIKGGIPMVGGALFGALCGTPGGPIGIALGVPIGVLIVFKGAHFFNLNQVLMKNITRLKKEKN